MPRPTPPSTNGHYTANRLRGDDLLVPLPDEQAWAEHFAVQRNLTDTNTYTNANTDSDTDLLRRGSAGIDVTPPKSGLGGCEWVTAAERQTGDELLDVVMSVVEVTAPPAAAARVPSKYGLLIRICSILQEMAGDK